MKFMGWYAICLKWTCMIESGWWWKLFFLLALLLNSDRIKYIVQRKRAIGTCMKTEISMYNWKDFPFRNSTFITMV
jgi:hypothetical protein